MNRLRVAIQVFRAILMSKDLSLTLRYGKKSELTFEQGCFADASEFLKVLKKRDNFPEHVLDQYKQVLSDYTYNYTKK